jgi:hypothetical protein
MKKMFCSLFVLMTTSFSAFSGTWFTCVDTERNQITFSTPDYIGLIKVEYQGDTTKLKYGFKDTGYGGETLASVFEDASGDVVFDTPYNAEIARIDGLPVGTKFALYRRSAIGINSSQRKLDCMTKAVFKI